MSNCKLCNIKQISRGKFRNFEGIRICYNCFNVIENYKKYKLKF